MKVLKSITVIPAGKTLGMFFAIAAFLIFLLGVIKNLFTDPPMSLSGGDTASLFVLGLLFCALFTAAGWFVGFACGALSATIYNFAAKHLGGIEVELGNVPVRAPEPLKWPVIKSDNSVT